MKLKETLLIVIKLIPIVIAFYFLNPNRSMFETPASICKMAVNGWEMKSYNLCPALSSCWSPLILKKSKFSYEKLIYAVDDEMNLSMSCRKDSVHIRPTLEGTTHLTIEKIEDLYNNPLLLRNRDDITGERGLREVSYNNFSQIIFRSFWVVILLIYMIKLLLKYIHLASNRSGSANAPAGLGR